MADGKVVIDTALDTSGFESGAKNLKNLVTGGVFAASIVALKNAVASVASDAETLNATIRKASTLFGSTGVNIDNLTKKIVALSTATGTSAESIGSALYDALSAGIPVTEDMGEAMDFLEKTIKTSKGGFADLSTTVTATASVLNAYGMAVSETDRVQGILLQTQNLGITTVAELGSTLAQVVPTAAAFGVSFEQVGAAMATMTASGTKTAQATTALNSLLSELGKQSQTGAKNLAEAAKNAGLSATSFSEMVAEGYDLSEILQVMNDYAESSGLSLVDMFGSVEAGRAALQLASNDGEKFTSSLEKMGDTAGVVDAAFKTVTSDYEKLQTALTNLKTTVGQAVTPALTTLASKATEIISKFLDQKTAAQDLTDNLELVKSATEAYKKAQEDAEAATNTTTGAMRTQAAVALSESYRQLGQAYDAQVDLVNGFTSYQYDPVSGLSASPQFQKQYALQQAQKAVDNFLYSNGLSASEADNATANGDTSVLSKKKQQEWSDLVAALQRAEEQYNSLNTAIATAEQNQAKMVEEAALYVRNGDLDVVVLKSYSSALADAAVEFNKLYDSGYQEGSDEVSSILNIWGDEKGAKRIQDIVDLLENLMSTMDKGSDTYAQYQGKVDALNEALVQLGITEEQVTATTESTTSSSSDDSDIKTQMQQIQSDVEKQIALADEMGKILGNSYDSASVKASAYQRAIQSLLSLSYGSEEEIEGLNDVLLDYQDALSDLDEPLEDVTDESYDWVQKLVDVSSALDANHELAKIFGDDWDENTNAVNILNNAIEELVENGFDHSSGAVTYLIAKLDELKDKMGEISDEKTFHDVMEDYFSDENVSERLGNAMASSIKAFTSEIDFFGTKAKELDSEIADAESDLLDMQEELADAQARGDESAVEALNEKIEGQNKLIKSLKNEKQEVQSGVSAWKAMGKAALNALAETLNGLGAQLAALAATKLVSLDFVNAGIASAGSIAAFLAASAITASAGKFATGGIVPRQAGVSAQGDQQMAYVNAGELILNMAQQKNLADQINALAQSGVGGGSPITINMDGNIYGLDSQEVGQVIYNNIRQLQSEGVI